MGYLSHQQAVHFQLNGSTKKEKSVLGSLLVEVREERHLALASLLRIDPGASNDQEWLI